MKRFRQDIVKTKNGNLDSYSQSYQDIFVALMTDYKTNGTFLEIGSFHPIEINNTYLLEKKYNWRGLGIDLKNINDLWFSCRKSKFWCKDATKINYDEIKDYLETDFIDYLSLDVDEKTNEVLKKINLQQNLFSIITIEHDYYRHFDKYKSEQKEILKQNGYKCVCEDVLLSPKWKIDWLPYEDWWVHEKFLKNDFYFINKKPKQIIEEILKGIKND